MTALDEWVCPVNPEWCDNHGCQGEDCTEHLASFPATHHPGYSSVRDDGVDFPYVTVSRVLVGGDLGIHVDVQRPHRWIAPAAPGSMRSTPAGAATAPLTRQQARQLRDQLTALLGN